MLKTRILYSVFIVDINFLVEEIKYSVFMHNECNE